MNPARRVLRKLWSDNANILGLFFGLAVLVVLLPGLLSGERMGVWDTGCCESVMQAAGLEYTGEELQNPEKLTYDHVIERYEYGSFSFEKLFAPSVETSVIYLAALIRLFTQPFGLGFSTVYLAVLYALLMAYAVYALVRGLAYCAGWPAAIAGAMLTVMLSSPNLAAFFNSLYPVAPVIVGTVLMAAMALRLFTYGKDDGTAGLARFLAAAVFCLNSSDLTVVFIPFVAAVTATALIRERRERSISLLTIVCAVLITACACSSAAAYRNRSADNTSDAAAYHAAFMGFLTASDDPVKDLQEFGLDESYAQDIGKSYYMDSEDYCHDPRDPEEARTLFEKLNRDSIGNWYRQNPKRLLRTVNSGRAAFNSFESELALRYDQRNSDEDRETRRWSAADTLMKILLPADYSGMVRLFALVTLTAAGAAVWLWRGGKKAYLPQLLAVWLLALGMFRYMPEHVRHMGNTDLEQARLPAVFFLVLGLGGSCAMLGRAADSMRAWFQMLQQSDGMGYAPEEWAFVSRLDEKFRRLPAAAGVKRGIDALLSSRGKTALIVMATALAMSAVIQFAPERAGCVNNGDFGRMMDQLGLIWQGDIFYDVGAQLGRRVIEEYAYRGPFDWTSLTCLNPRYSLVYPAALVRLFCTLTDQPFSTWYLSILMNLVLIVCIVSIVYDLHPLLGRMTLFFGLGLCAVFLCESNLVWLNSLYGESCIFMGLFMVIACCVHLAVAPENSSWLWVLLLLFSGRILVCAKAQMILALPIVLLLIVFFALYQRPLPLKGLIPYTVAVMVGCVLLSLEGYQIYKDNSEISDRQTIWQATFYGALMVTDDPQGAMEELGIDVSMMPDIGKDAYQPDGDYVISPNSAQADAALYDHVNTFTMVKYYLRHPGQLLKMLNHAAEVSRTVYNSFRAYGYQDYSGEHDPVQRLGLWLYWRQVFTCGSFMGYVLLYGTALAVGVRMLLLSPEADIRKKLLFFVFAGVMLIGAIQYPLSVVGNGFADNHKQMFGFMMCHDYLVLFSMAVIGCYLKNNEHGIINAARHLWERTAGRTVKEV